MGNKTSHIDGVANILTADESEGDDQPVRKAGLSMLAGKSEALVTRTEGFCAENRDGSQYTLFAFE